MIGVGILWTVTALALGVAANAIINTRRVERSRPSLPSDDAPGDIANLPEGFLFHRGVDTDASA